MDYLGNDGIRLPDGQLVPWDLLQAGKYQVVNELPDLWDVVFARVSTSEQVIEGCSLQQQVEFANTAARRAGQGLTAVYVDPGKSATRLSFERREGVRTLLEDVRRRKVRTIYVYKRDRISRTAIDWSIFLKTCATFGTNIVFTCPEEPPIGQGAYGQFAEMIIIAAAELEASITRVRVIDSIINRFNNGLWIGGPLPYGLSKDADGRIVPEPAEAPVVQEIYRLAQEELLGGMRIADRINQQFPGSRRGAMWDRIQVMRVLKNRTYCGYFTLEIEVEKEGRRQREIHERRAEHLPILVPEETWAQVAAMKATRTHRRDCDPSRHRASPNLLLGLLRCGICGRKMRARHMVQPYRRKDGSTGETHTRYYLCINGMNVRGCTYRRHLPLEPVEEAVVDALVQRLGQVNEAVIIARAKAVRESQLTELRGKLESVQKEIRQTEAALRRNQVFLERVTEGRELAYYEARIRELIRQRELQCERQAALEGQLEQARGPAITEGMVRRALAKWPELFAGAPAERKRAMLEDAIERVVWYPERRQVDLVFKLDPNLVGSAGEVFYAE